MLATNLVSELFDAGLGESFILHVADGRPFLGQLVLEKGRLTLKDRGLLHDVTAEQLKSCFSEGICGALCHKQGSAWESLTFVGPERCRLSAPLDPVYKDIMQGARNAFGERLLDFTGSIYRGYQLLMDNYFLPVVLLQTIDIDDGLTGLAVANLRAAKVPMDTLGLVHSKLHKVMDLHMTLEVQDVEMSDSDFDDLFGQFKDSGAA